MKGGADNSCQLLAIRCQQKEMKDLKDLPLFLQTPDFCLQTSSRGRPDLCALCSAFLQAIKSQPGGWKTFHPHDIVSSRIREYLATGPPRSSTEVCLGLLRRYPDGLAFLGFVFFRILLWGTGKRPMAGILFEKVRGTGGLSESSFPEDFSMCFELLLGRMQPPVSSVSAVW